MLKSCFTYYVHLCICLKPPVNLGFHGFLSHPIMYKGYAFANHSTGFVYLSISDFACWFIYTCSSSVHWYHTDNLHNVITTMIPPGDHLVFYLLPFIPVQRVMFSVLLLFFIIELMLTSHITSLLELIYLIIYIFSLMHKSYLFLLCSPLHLSIPPVKFEIHIVLFFTLLSNYVNRLCVCYSQS